MSKNKYTDRVDYRDLVTMLVPTSQYNRAARRFRINRSKPRAYILDNETQKKSIDMVGEGSARQPVNSKKQ